MTTEKDFFHLEAKNLRKLFSVKEGFFGHPKTIRALDGISIGVEKGTTLGIVGESGCGKTTLGRILCLLETPSEGTILYDGKEVQNLKGKKLKEFRREAFEPCRKGRRKSRVALFRQMRSSYGRLHGA